MNNIARFFTVLSLTVLLFAASAHAQYNDKKVTASIPFDFGVGGIDLHAGNYVFLRTGANSLLVRDADGKDLLTVLTGSASDFNAPSLPKLRFKTVAGRKVLFQVWQGDSNGMELYHSRPALAIASYKNAQTASGGR